MASRCAAVVAVSFFALASHGCSQHDDPGPPDLGHFASRMAVAFCDALHACCAAQGFAYDDGSCLAQTSARFQAMADPVKHGSTRYHPENVQNCASAVASVEARCTGDAGGAASAGEDYIDPITAACWNVFVGTAQPGGACTDSGECAVSGPNQTAQCEQVLASDAGAADPNDRVCYVVTEHVMPGGECDAQPKAGTYTYATCEPRVGWCDTSASRDAGISGSGTCKEYARVGDGCGIDQAAPCNPQTSYCDYGGTNTCVALLGDGASCARAPGQCEPGSYCDPSVVQCRPLPNNAGNEPLGDVSPRSCGFGPQSTGPEDAGIVLP